MVVDTGTAILILGAFVLPGFIRLILRERLYVVHDHEAPFERLLSALLYSALIYGVCWSPPIASVSRSRTWSNFITAVSPSATTCLRPPRSFS